MKKGTAFFLGTVIGTALGAAATHFFGDQLTKKADELKSKLEEWKANKENTTAEEKFDEVK